MMIKNPWEIKNRVIFNEIPVEYDKARWEYPAALYADIFEYQRQGQDGHGNRNAIEIGAGTGKATTPFLEAGYNVTAVELGDNMAAFLRDKFKDNSHLKVLVSSFEDAALEEDHFNLIYAASAFHWVDASIGCPKVFRLLENNGIFALFRNNVAGVFGREKEEEALYDKYYYSYYNKKEPKLWSTREGSSTPEGIYRGFRFYDMAEYGFTDIQMKFYEEIITYTADGYVALLETQSDHRSLPEENRKALLEGIHANIMKNGGKCKQNYLFQLYMGRKLK